MELSEIIFLDIEENEEYLNIVNKVLKSCFESELKNKKLTVNVTLTNPKKIQELNNQYRNIDKPTDVLSFPMFEKEELINLDNQNYYILGDIVISIEKVKEQAVEYEHSFERELSYMVVHGFCHLLGYDHIEEEDKKVMRKKEEEILAKI
ncbi:MAG: rRNA maturation RNase YbeY [Clostridia bacterium]|nr:rRNA maturation RNase YbeY [Clostridia bacterium]